jgi:hypothetical protein
MRRGEIKESEREIKNEMVLDNRIKFFKINNRTALFVTVFDFNKMEKKGKIEKILFHILPNISILF